MSASGLDVERIGTIAVVSVGPEFEKIEELAAEQVSPLLLDLVATDDLDAVVIDLSPTIYFTSTFLGTLIRVHRRLREHGARLVLCGLQRPCLEVLQVTQLDKLWTICADRTEAIDAANAPPRPNA